ncbi:hypothetical protein ABBQ38_000488 [Trebouxia sp. C0009 RCD-2024]
MFAPSTGAVGNEAEEVREELQQIEDDRAAQSDDYPTFQLIPKEMLVGRGKSLRLLPNDMGTWHTKIPGDNPAQALVLAKQMTVMVYEGARKLYGDLSPVLVPPRASAIDALTSLLPLATHNEIDGSRQMLRTEDTVCKDCSILIEDPEVRNKVLWDGMQLVAPWENDAVSDDIFTVNPTFIPRDRLSSAQQSVCDEMQKQLEMCEFVYYWSKERWCIELLEELRGGFS